MDEGGDHIKVFTGCISVTIHTLRSNSLTSNPVGVGVVWCGCCK